jgi:cytochrome c peroxidase
MRAKLWSMVVCSASLGAVSAVSLAFVACGGSKDAPPSHVDIDVGIEDTGVRDSTVVDSSVVDSRPTDSLAIDTTPEASPDVLPDALDGDTDDGFVPGPPRLPPTIGGAAALSTDDKIFVSVDRNSATRSVTVLDIDYSGGLPAPKNPRYLATTSAAEAWSVVMGADDDSAFAIYRKTQQIVKIAPLRSTTTLSTTLTAATGSEPTGLARSPTGTYLYVANFADGTVSIFKSADLSLVKTLDLNGTAASFLGAPSARPGLAHPRAIAITNDGDDKDDDETVYVTEFFSQARPSGTPTDDSQFDLNRVGVVYAFAAVAPAGITPITIAPVVDTGFKDSSGTGSGITGCFPNQLYSADVNNGRVYVTSVCESPRGPIGLDTVTTTIANRNNNFKTQVHASIFVIDTKTNKELPTEGIRLTQQFQKTFDADLITYPDDSDRRRLPLIPIEIRFVTGQRAAYVASYGTDALFRVEYKADGSLLAVGATAAPFIVLGAPTGGPSSGRLPIGLASANALIGIDPYMFVSNEATRNLSVVSLTRQNVLATASLDPDAPTAVDNGKRLFNTGLGRWSLSGQGWNSCGSCHPDGLTDNVTWFFGRGPRQTTSLDATYDPTGTKRRLLNWTAIFDEVHDFELNTRGNSGGVGAMVVKTSTPPSISDRITFETTYPSDAGADAGDATQFTGEVQNGLNGTTIGLMPGGPETPHTILTDWDDIDAYVKTIRSPRAPTNLVPADVTAGKTLFQNANCAGCHGGALWTLSQVFYTPGAVNNSFSGLLRTTDYTAPDTFPPILNPPTKNASRIAKLRYEGTDIANQDQIYCILRDVGTFPVAGTTGIAPTGVVVREVRSNMSAVAQGVTGFNPPSLLGLVTGGPYFHAGNARTLEELFDKLFYRHYQAHDATATFLNDSPTRADQVRQLVAFLLSLDDGTTPIPVPTSTTLGFDVDLCRLTGSVTIP